MTRDSGVHVSERMVPARSRPGHGHRDDRGQRRRDQHDGGHDSRRAPPIGAPAGQAPTATAVTAASRPERDDEVGRADEPDRRDDEQGTEPGGDEVDGVHAVHDLGVRPDRHRDHHARRERRQRGRDARDGHREHEVRGEPVAVVEVQPHDHDGDERQRDREDGRPSRQQHAQREAVRWRLAAARRRARPLLSRAARARSPRS